MIKYKNDLRMRVSARKGTVTEPDFDETPGYETPLNKEIVICAGRHVKGQRLRAFFWAYHCAHSWENIQDKFLKHLKSEVDEATVERYARDAANRIVDRIVTK